MVSILQRHKQRLSNLNPQKMDWKKPTQKLLRCGALPFSDAVRNPFNEGHLFGQGLDQRVSHHIHVTTFLTCAIGDIDIYSLHIQEASKVFYDSLTHTDIQQGQELFLIYRAQTACCGQAGGPDSVGSCGSARDAPPVCSAACSCVHSNCTYRASPQLGRKLK